MFYTLVGGTEQSVDVLYTFLVLEGLLIPASYLVQVAAIGLGGELGQRSGVLRIRSETFVGFFAVREVESIPLELSVIDVQMTSITITWRAPIDINGLQVRVYYMDGTTAQN